MFSFNNFNNYFLRLITERNIRQNTKKKLKNDYIQEIEEVIKEKNELKECEKFDKKYKDLKWVKCENQKCGHHTCPEHLLSDLHDVLTVKFGEDPKRSTAEQKELLGLVLNCEDKDKESLDNKRHLLKPIDIQCRECKHDLTNVKFTPCYVLQLQRNSSKVKLNH